MTEYVRGLWLGGGISREALEAIEFALRVEAPKYEHPVRTELLNVANAAHADLTKMSKPMSDLV